MTSLFSILAILMPLLAASFTALPNRFVDARSYRAGFGALVMGFLASMLVLFSSIQASEPIDIFLFASPWPVLPVVELSVDRLSAVMMAVISAIGMVIYRYSISYMQQDPDQPRFHALLGVAIFTLLFMVSSADLLSLFLSWQLLSWILCLLFHNFSHVPTVQSTFRTFVILRLGDVMFLCGIALAFHLYGTVQFTELFEQAASNQVLIDLWGSGLTMTGATAVALLIFFGAMSKSAQFPMHSWLPDSLYGPTPISGLLHAGIINAGGFLLNRLAPLYVLTPTTLHIVLFVGLITMLVGKSMMLVKNDIKKTLGYSTIGQMGYMIMECGVGAFSLAVFHLIAHGLFKATVFLNCGDVIHKARLEPERPIMPSPDSPGLLGWLTGFVVSLLMPLAIVVASHYVLGISILDSQGIFIFLLFGWVTASHAMLTLFRLQSAWLMIVSMLAAVSFASVSYFFAAEQFTHFLYPDHSQVSAYFEAAALPHGVFLLMAAVLVLSIGSSWFGLYLHYHDKFVPHSGRLWTQLYLLFANRLYIYTIELHVYRVLKRLARLLNSSPAGLVAFVIAAIFFAGREIGPAAVLFENPPFVLILSFFLLPLFPFHGLYVAALTRTPGWLAMLLSVLLPAFGFLAFPGIPASLLPALGVLAAFGAIWGSLKALSHDKVPELIAYAGLSMYSILWWHLAQVGKFTAQSLQYAVAVGLVSLGLILAWNSLRSRYAELDLTRVGGLFRPMPRFAFFTALIIMASVGLPPFGLFFGYLGMLVSPSITMSPGLVAVVFSWFAASWYFFNLMQRLLFGPVKSEFRYEDIRRGEIAGFALVIGLLIVLGGLPQDWLELAVNGAPRVIGGLQWTQ